jgi:hypothetical protein
MNCFELEINQCESNQYQCHNGMCIPEEFFNDGLYDPECLDSTDENYDISPLQNDILGFYYCFVDPSFRCEDAFHPQPGLDFTCGDGQQNFLQLFTPNDSSPKSWSTCWNGRDLMLRKLLLLDAEQTNLTYECWVLMSCLTYAGVAGMCKDLCNNTASDAYCEIQIQSKCNVSPYVIFPLISISPSNGQAGYWTGRTILYKARPNVKTLPDFFCYDVHLCPYFSPTFKIGHRTCINHSDIGLDKFANQARLFDQCLTINKSGNETDCFHPSLFHCPGTSKCISKRRLLDGIVDCYGSTDETYVGSCQLNDKHRFQCTSEDKCVSHIAVQDNIKHCRGGEDEMALYEVTLYYLNLCNGYTHMSQILVDEQNETDETNCEEWPCDNQYTRCDGAWTCRDGADEVNCNQESKCYPDQHECVSPSSFEVICLPKNRSGDGKVDCLGGTDESQYCLSVPSYISGFNYLCWNETKCAINDCADVTRVCLFERNIVSFDKCVEENGVMQNVLRSLNEAEKVRTIDRETIDSFFKYKYFTLYNSNSTHTSKMNKQLHSHVHSSMVSDVFTTFDEFTRLRSAWICNRGILIYMNTERIEHCLCPPAYYGNRCQFQSQRISLTLKFSKECFLNCSGIYAIVVILIDQNQIIHSYEQFMLQTTEYCDLKYNLNLLYKSRPKNQSVNYAIYIHAYNIYDLSYYSSWILPVKFLFLPVNRIAAHLIIPLHGNATVDQCPLGCGDHGHCNVFINNGKSFCRCDSGWSGQRCEVQNNDSYCSPDSLYLVTVNKRSICVCPISKYGPRCFLHQLCTEDICKNGGICIVVDDQLFPYLNRRICICKEGYSGTHCEIVDTQVDFSFNRMKIPQSLFVYFITVQIENDPIIVMLSKKIPFDQDKTTLFALLPFNLILAQVHNEYYLVHQKVNASDLLQLSIEIQSSHRCSPIDELLDKHTLSFPLLRRAKYYHVACRRQPQLTCFYDIEGLMCLCDQERFANCLHLNFSSKPQCQLKSICENDGECYPNRHCPTSTMCVCRECYFGTKCQLTTKGFGISLDTILGYQIRKHLSIPHQTAAVKVSIAMTTIMIFIGLISGIFLTMTFSSKNLLGVGCGFYLRTLSILSMISASILTVKLWLLISTQSLWMTNRVVLWINCISMQFILRCLPAIGDWLCACIAIERTVVVIKGVTFNKDKSKQVSRWMIVGVILLTTVSVIHDPIHRQLIDDEEEQRTWCVVRYSSTVQIFDAIIHIFHFIIPFLINLISSAVIIINVARTHSNAHKKQPYKQHLRKQFREHKHLIVSPIILVLLGVPRLIISFLSGCMGSVRDPWLFLFGYFISFLPSLLIPIIFTLPSEVYRKELMIILKAIQNTIQHCLCPNRSR